MTTTRRFRADDDLFRFNSVNLDAFTETYGFRFYMQYQSEYPEFNFVQESLSGEVQGYVLGKSEGAGAGWHAHVTAVTVSPEFRRQGLASQLMTRLESIGKLEHARFVDLFVRTSNSNAVDFYKKRGYIVYRRVIGYYSGNNPEDAYDMRKAIPEFDPEGASVVPVTRPVYPKDLEWD